MLKTIKIFPSVIRYLKSLISDNKKLFIKLIISIILLGLIQYTFPLFTKLIVDKGINPKNVEIVQLILFGQVMFFLGQSTLLLYKNWLNILVSSNVSLRITKEFLKKLTKIPIIYFESHSPGDLLQRIIDIRRIDYFITNTFLLAIFSSMNLIVYSIILAGFDIYIFLISILFLIISIIWVKYFSKKRKVSDLNLFNANSLNNNKIYQILNGIKDIKLSNSESNKIEDWELSYKQVNNSKIKNSQINQYQFSGTSFLSQLRNIIITFIAANLVIDNTITMGTMLAITYINGQFSAPVDQLLGFTQAYQDAGISISRLEEIYVHTDEDSQENNPTIIDNFDIIVKDLTFYYPNTNNRIILNKINMDFKYGKFISIVGKSGEGKTTLIKLLLKFYDTYNGSINYGKNNLKLINYKDLRKYCSVVFQDSFIFNDTIANNIVMGHSYEDTTKLNETIKIANIFPFINSLENGLNTILGANGRKISEGQKQRILIARALYKNPNYIFFDEATSALDMINEDIIFSNIRDYSKIKTLVYTSHRLSSVKKADHIIVLEQGTIVEQGNFIELCKKKNAFYKLFQNQM